MRFNASVIYFCPFSNLKIAICREHIFADKSKFGCYTQRKYFYRPQTKFAKVMLLHVSVILSTEVGGPWSREGACSGRYLLQRDLVPGGCLVETLPRRLLLRAVRILLECILVMAKFPKCKFLVIHDKHLNVDCFLVLDFKLLPLGIRK